MSDMEAVTDGRKDGQTEAEQTLLLISAHSEHVSKQSTAHFGYIQGRDQCRMKNVLGVAAKFIRLYVHVEIRVSILPKFEIIVFVFILNIRPL